MTMAIAKRQWCSRIWWPTWLVALVLVSEVAWMQIGEARFQGMVRGARSKDFEELTSTPTIGVLTVPVEHGEAGRECVSRRRRLGDDQGLGKDPTSCFNAVYARWLESAGAQVVPIPFDLPKDEIKKLLQSVNGVLFTGGEVPLREENRYMDSARFIFGQVVSLNDQGIYFPLWGTCMGMQLLSVLVGGPSVLEFNKYKGVDGTMLPLNFTSKASHSKMFHPNSIPDDIYQYLESFNVTTNYHHDGVLPSSFERNENLKAFYHVLSTNQDSNNKPFASTIEVKRYPIYGVQFHPERSQFDFRQHDPVNHSFRAVAANYWTAFFFVNQARRNSHSFASFQTRSNALIWNFVPSGQKENGNYLF